MLVRQWFEKRMNMAQTVWSGMQYALISDDARQCCPFVYCKEFILDAVWAAINKQPVSVFGFFYHPEFDPPVATEQVRMLIRNIYDDKFPDRVPKCVKFLNKLEDEFGFPHTTAEVCENADSGGLQAAPPVPDRRGPIYAFTCPGNWMQAPPLLSLLTLMFRVGMIYNGKDALWTHAEKVSSGRLMPYQKRDNEHLHRAYRCIRDLVDTKCARFLPERKSNWPILKGRFAAIGIHEEGGIVSLSTGMGRYVQPAWYPKPPAPVEQPKVEVATA